MEQQTPEVTKVWRVKKSGVETGELLELDTGSGLASLGFNSSQEAQQTLQAHGFEVERVYGMEDKCEIDDHRSCDLRSAAGMATDWMQMEGKPLPPTLAKIQEGGYFTETELQAALVEVHNNMPEEYKVDVIALQEALWGPKDGGSNG